VAQPGRAEPRAPTPTAVFALSVDAVRSVTLEGANSGGMMVFAGFTPALLRIDAV